MELRKFSLPFNHVTAEKCLQDWEIDGLMSFGKSQLDKSSFSQAPAYNARILSLGSKEKLILSRVITSPAWLKVLSNALSVPLSLEIDVAIHYHPPGSKTGWLHNDFNAGWFPHAAADNGVVYSDYNVTDYRAGPGVLKYPAVRRARGIAIILYLNNGHKSDEDGGQTLLSESAQWKSPRDKLVSPKTNSLLAFECSPISWHAFQTTLLPRWSLMMWTHRSIDGVREQWPNHELVLWQ